VCGCGWVGGWVGGVSRYVTTFGAQLPHLLLFNGPFHLQANLRQKVTHSMQTDLSHYKRDNATQVNLPRYTRMNLTRQPFRLFVYHINFFHNSFCCCWEFTNSTFVYSERETQTKRDQGTSIPKPSTYIAGLRGHGDLSPQTVDLTLHIDIHNNITT